jgi:Na+/phosphate symporter
VRITFSHQEKKMSDTRCANVKELNDRLSSAVKKAAGMLRIIYDGFLLHNNTWLDRAGNMAKELSAEEKKATETLACCASDTQENRDLVRTIISVPGHLGRITGSAEQLIACIRVKIKDGILFSDRAVTELKDLFETASGLLQNVSDALITRNRVLMTHVTTEANSFSQRADEYAGSHEERLITGMCSPKSSSLYLDILHLLRNVVWHTKEIAERM